MHAGDALRKLKYFAVSNKIDTFAHDKPNVQNKRQNTKKTSLKRKLGTYPDQISQLEKKRNFKKEKLKKFLYKKQ